MKKYILGSLLLGLVSGAAVTLFGANWIGGPKDDGEPAKNPGTLSASQPDGALVCLGSVDVEGGVLSLYPSIPGKVASVCVKEGDPVAAGAVLFRLEDDLARFQLQEAQAALQAAEAQLKTAQDGPKQHQLLIAQQKASLLALGHDLKSAHLLATSKDKVVANKFLAPEEAAAAWEQYKKLQAAEQAEKAKLAALELTDPAHAITRAQADVAAKKAQVDRAQYGLDQCAVKAPVAGTVSRILTGRGEVLGPVPRQPALMFCPSLPRIVRAEVEQEFAGVVHIGQEALILDDARSSAPGLKGKVTRLADMYTPRRTSMPTSLPIPELRVLEFIVEIDSSPVPLHVGQRVRVKLRKEKEKHSGGTP